jgi:signal peptidase I
MRKLWEWFWPIGIGVAAALLVMRYVVSVAFVPSASMVSIIPNPCRILVNHIAIEFSNIYEGEVVLFHFPDKIKEIYVKRVIGLPGDTIDIHNGHVYRNGVMMNEPYLHGIVTEGTFGPYHVPPNSYFMLGDNRNISSDSRFWIHKYVLRKQMIGRADYVVWPITKENPIQ